MTKGQVMQMNVKEFMAELYRGVPPEQVTYLFTLPDRATYPYKIGQMDQMLEKAMALNRSKDVYFGLHLIHKGRVGEVYNIGGHNEMRNIDIVKLICKELGKPESLITYVTDRKGHDMRYAIDPTKIHSELGWLPETRFADGIQKTIAWYLENREWWETIISGEYQNYYEKMYGNR